MFVQPRYPDPTNSIFRTDISKPCGVRVQVWLRNQVSCVHCLCCVHMLILKHTVLVYPGKKPTKGEIEKMDTLQTKEKLDKSDMLSQKGLDAYAYVLQMIERDYGDSTKPEVHVQKMHAALPFALSDPCLSTCTCCAGTLSRR